MKHAVSLQMALMGAPEKGTELSPPEVYEKVRPEVWADGTPGKDKNAWLTQIVLKRGAGTPNLKQCPLSQEARKGMQPILKMFLKTGLTMPCRSPYSTAILLVKEPDSTEYHFV